VRRVALLVGVLSALPVGGASPTLTAVVSDSRGARLAAVDPATFASVHVSKPIGWYDGWARSPDGKLVAVAVHADAKIDFTSTLRFATAATLALDRRGVPLHGIFRAAVWPTVSRLFAVTGDCCNATLALETVDTVAKRVVSVRALEGTASQFAHAGSALVLLGGDDNAIVPARVTVIDADGSVRSVRLDRILAGWHYDQSSQDPIGTVRQPGLAVDPVGGVAYVVDADGLVAAVRLSDLSVTYHMLALRSLAEAAKGENGPVLTAQWLGGGLLAVTGNEESAARQPDLYASTPYGLRVIDTSEWSVRTIDPQADTVFVAGSLLVASGGTYRYDGSGETTSGEGVAAYGLDGSLRWRFAAGTRVSLLDAYGSRAIVEADVAHAQPQLLDLATGRVVRTLPVGAYLRVLHGTGS